MKWSRVTSWPRGRYKMKSYVIWLPSGECLSTNSHLSFCFDRLSNGDVPWKLRSGGPRDILLLGKESKSRRGIRQEARLGKCISSNIRQEAGFGELISSKIRQVAGLVKFISSNIRQEVGLGEFISSNIRQEARVMVPELWCQRCSSRVVVQEPWC